MFSGQKIRSSHEYRVSEEKVKKYKGLLVTGIIARRQIEVKEGVRTIHSFAPWTVHTL